IFSIIPLLFLLGRRCIGFKPYWERDSAFLLSRTDVSFYHSVTIEEIVTEAGCKIWYLPPYSPDLNNIEHWWSALKNWMRQRWDEFDSFRDCVDAAFKQCPNVFA
ncbi:transposase, partial [Coleofasciculus sp. FACHB-1120]|uniref:transposase n=1 Tax=Coleofasciculus sp. FACHB-1120 TaxID=2692783 RepID=UPI001F5545CB